MEVRATASHAPPHRSHRGVGVTERERADTQHDGHDTTGETQELTETLSGDFVL